jgi:hypothetical protein
MQTVNLHLVKGLRMDGTRPPLTMPLYGVALVIKYGDNFILTRHLLGEADKNHEKFQS